MKHKEAFIQAENTLRDVGARVTVIRQALLTLFFETVCALSAHEILATLEKRGVSANKSTIYREIDFLISHQMIRAVWGSARETYYELSASHHHHLICTSCSSIDQIEFDDDVSVFEKLAKKQKQFSPSNHVLDLHGICASCRDKTV